MRVCAAQYLVMEAYLEGASPHGIKYLSRSQPKLLRFVWSIVLIVALTYASLMIVDWLEAKRDNPVATSLRTEPINHIPFPALTFSLNPSPQYDNFHTTSANYLATLLDNLEFDCMEKESFSDPNCSRNQETYRKPFEPLLSVAAETAIRRVWGIVESFGNEFQDWKKHSLCNNELYISTFSLEHILRLNMSSFPLYKLPKELAKILSKNLRLGYSVNYGDIKSLRDSLPLTSFDPYDENSWRCQDEDFSASNVLANLLIAFKIVAGVSNSRLYFGRFLLTFNDGKQSSLFKRDQPIQVFEKLLNLDAGERFTAQEVLAYITDSSVYGCSNDTSECCDNYVGCFACSCRTTREKWRQEIGRKLQLRDLLPLIGYSVKPGLQLTEAETFANTVSKAAKTLKGKSLDGTGDFEHAKPFVWACRKDNQWLEKCFTLAWTFTERGIGYTINMAPDQVVLNHYPQEFRHSKSDFQLNAKNDVTIAIIAKPK